MYADLNTSATCIGYEIRETGKERNGEGVNGGPFDTMG